MRIFVVLALGLGFAAQALAEVRPLPQDRAVMVARLVAEAADKIKDPPIKLDADHGAASGLYGDGGGLVIIPRKGLKEAGENLEGVEDSLGAPVAYLGLYRILPVSGDNPVNRAQVHTVTVQGDDGEEREITVLRLAVKKISDAEYHLLVFGKDKKPLVSSPFREEPKDTDRVLTVDLRDLQADRATLVITGHGKYAAEIRLTPDSN